MADHLTSEIILPAAPQTVYEAWLDSFEHTAFTGGEAEIDSNIGGQFSAWDGYITGRTLELEPFTRIVQSWRTTEFPENAPDSKLEILITPAPKGCQLTLNHTEIPAGQGKQYDQGWKDFYFEPMLKYFKELLAED